MISGMISCKLEESWWLVGWLVGWSVVFLCGEHSSIMKQTKSVLWDDPYAVVPLRQKTESPIDTIMMVDGVTVIVGKPRSGK